MNDSIPGEAGIIDYDVDFAVAKLGRLLDEFVDVVVLEHITCYCNGTATALID